MHDVASSAITDGEEKGKKLIIKQYIDALTSLSQEIIKNLGNSNKRIIFLNASKKNIIKLSYLKMYRPYC